MKTYFDAIERFISPLINELWGYCPNKIALFVRGSSLIHTDTSTPKPLDIDILLFVLGDTEKACLIARETAKKCHRAYPLIPHLDIKVVDCSITTPESIFNTLLASQTGQLIAGKDLSLPISQFKNNHHELVQFSLDKAEAKLDSVIKTTDLFIQKQRLPHLSKSILRIGGLLKLNEGFFTRSPSEGALILCELVPKTINDVTVILESFEIQTSPKALFRSYVEVLNMIKEKYCHA